MNIFVVDLDPRVAATMLCDKHATKMGLEGCQIMTAVMYRYNLGDRCTYKLTHRNHPCTLWAGDSRQNFTWLWQHTQELFKEYTRRYGRIHKSEQYLVEYVCPEAMPDIGLTPFAQTMPDHYKHEDVVTAYRNFYMGDKRAFAKWKTKKPDWFK